MSDMCLTIQEALEKLNESGKYEPHWYNTIRYNTYSIEKIINDAHSDYIYAYFKDSQDIKSFTISDVKPTNKIIVTNLDDLLDLNIDYNDGDCDDSIKKRWRELILNGAVGIETEYLNDYPDQGREDFCTMINCIWEIGIWYESAEETKPEVGKKELLALTCTQCGGKLLSKGDTLICANCGTRFYLG